ncbi:hypothetical protein GCM10011316_21740 [Roseibium aquae]|uniref:BrnA antitoxin of type II toxin-antitoxin system n=1 Tax=Roseibium aquae TaxID=1323746 RepID=A0A916X1W5_9HYPH|nr:BrnA antitoxin family protein [Roseibium aquae]GGB49265.1 hypothetical protein GCM10011316_21740 [Roseibium aquae]
MTQAEFETLDDEDIDFSDIPATDEAFWADARVVLPKTKQVASLRLDPEVISFFKEKFPRKHTSAMADVLRQYVEHAKARG